MSVESTIAKLRNVSVYIFGSSSFLSVMLAILIFEGISFSINTSYFHQGKVVIPFGGLPVIIATFLIFSSIFSVAMIIATEILISRLFTYSMITSLLSVVAVIGYLFLNYFRATGSAYALLIKPFIEIVSPIIVILNIVSIFIIYYMRKLERSMT